MNFQARALMTADEIMKMRKNAEIILMEASPPIKAKKCYWFREKDYRGLLASVRKN